MKKYISKSAKQTEKIGEKLAKKLKAGATVFLYGGLGYGKTTFVKGVARGLGVKSRIISPTFVLIRSHRKLTLIDLYRIESKRELEGIGLEEVLSDKSRIKLVEWPEKLTSLPGPRIDIKFIMNKDNTRTIKVIEHG